MERAASIVFCSLNADDGARAFEVRISEWRGWGFRLALKITGCPEAAHDALQNATLRALRSRRALRDPGAELAWFRKIVVRCAMDQKPPASIDVDSLQISDEQELEERIQVRRTLSRLKPSQRAILALALGEEFSYAEIAEILGIPMGTVASQLNAAKEAFRRLWREEE